MMTDWQINYGMKPAAKLVDIRFAGHDDLIEECLKEMPDEWEWSLADYGGCITMYRIVEPLVPDSKVRMTQVDEYELV